MLLLFAMSSMQAHAVVLNITGGSLAQVSPADDTEIVNIVSQFTGGNGVSSLSGSVTFTDLGNGLINVTDGILNGDNGTLEVNYDNGTVSYSAIFFAPYSWDLIAGAMTGTFDCVDAVSCASVNNASQTDWGFLNTTGTTFVDNGDGTGSVVLDALTVRGDTFSWSLTGDVVSAVPVPAAVWLFGSGLIGLAGVARRKRISLPA
jgi:hypothetical protein